MAFAENRVDPSINFSQIVEKLEGCTGLDIKEAHCEAVVKICHKQARLLDQGYFVEENDDTDKDSLSSVLSGSAGTR